MKSQSTAQLQRSLTNHKILIVGMLFVLVGAAEAYFFGGVEGGWGNAINSIGSTMISVGLLSLVFEIVLRRDLAEEMSRLVGIQRSVLNSNFSENGLVRDMDWPYLLRDRSDYRAIFVDPVSWLDNNFQSCIESARKRKVTIRIVIPDREADYFAGLAESIERDPKRFGDGIDEAVDRISTLWTRERDAGALKSQSELDIRVSPMRPLYSLLAADHIDIVMIEAITKSEVGERSLATVYAGDATAYPSSWFKDQLEKSKSWAVKFTNVVS